MTASPMPFLRALPPPPLPVPPRVLWARPLEATLNALFADALRHGDLQFLNGRRVRIRLERPALAFSLTLDRGRLRVEAPELPAALTIEGGLREYLALASRREDADTLFFQRRLHMTGDTELGLYVKNFLDGLDPEEHPQLRAVSALAAAALDGLERLPGAGRD
jgi:predicted lipid carrier protein YhbT